MAFNDKVAKEQITITLSGNTRSGKSTISVLLYNYLTELGFETKFIDADNEKFASKYLESIKDRMKDTSLLKKDRQSFIIRTELNTITPIEGNCNKCIYFKTTYCPFYLSVNTLPCYRYNEKGESLRSVKSHHLKPKCSAKYSTWSECMSYRCGECLSTQYCEFQQVPVLLDKTATVENFKKEEEMKMGILDKMGKEAGIRKSFESVINTYSLENESNTPDFILAGFLLECLKVFQMSTKARNNWYAVHLEPGNKYFEDDKEEESEEDLIKRQLKPCPFCGELPEVFHQDYSGDIYVGDEYLLECSCGNGSIGFDKKEKIIENWNRRVK